MAVAQTLTAWYTDSETWIRPGEPVLSMRLAKFTVVPQMSNCGVLPWRTPAVTGPIAIPYRMAHCTVCEASFRAYFLMVLGFLAFWLALKWVRFLMCDMRDASTARMVPRSGCRKRSLKTSAQVDAKYSISTKWGRVVLTLSFGRPVSTVWLQEGDGTVYKPG